MIRTSTDETTGACGADAQSALGGGSVRVVCGRAGQGAAASASPTAGGSAGGSGGGGSGGSGGGGQPAGESGGDATAPSSVMWTVAALGGVAAAQLLV